MATLTIDGTVVPTPAKMNVELLNVGSNAERCASGRLVCDRVAVKRKWKLTWAMLNAADTKLLLRCADGFFTAVFPDPMTGEMRSGTFFASSRSVQAFRLNGSDSVWSEISMEWTEQ